MYAINNGDLFPAQARLAAIVASSGDAIISKDLTGTITSWNRGAELIFGYTAEEAIGKPITMLMPEDRINEEPGILSRIMKGENVGHYDTIRQHKDGHRIDISLSVSPIYDEQGRIIGASKIARDISDRKTDEAELAKLASIVEHASDAIISKDLNGIITSWNQGAEQVFGYTADEAVGMPVTMLMSEDRVNEEPAILERIRRGENVDHYETIRRHKDGTLLNISLNISPVRDAHGVIIGASKIARDITLRRRAEAAFRETEIMHRLVEAQEADRHRIARDLHDHLGQQMTALRLKIRSLIVKSANDGHQLEDEIEQLEEVAHQIDRDIGFLSWELRPTELDHLGLKETLAAFVNEWSRQYGIDGEFQASIADDAGPRLSKTVETNLYRILQEGLNNILKHAEAQHVSVLLHRREDHIMLTIEDDGKGFDPSIELGNGGTAGGLGLVGMRERAALLKGNLEIESASGKGTTVLIRIPNSISG